MRFLRLLVLFLLLVDLGKAQEPTPVRDIRAQAVLQQSFAAQGGSIPGDSVASGSIRIVAGSLTEEGRIELLTRGADQALERIATDRGERGLVLSQGRTAELQGESRKRGGMELAVSSSFPYFPLFLIGAALNKEHASFEYIGFENVEGTRAHHVVLGEMFPSQSKLAHLTGMSKKHLWVSQAGLPLKLSYEQRHGGGGIPAIRIECTYADYRNVTGVLYPHLIECSINGTPWATINVTSVSMNTGRVSASDFRLQ